MHRTSLDSDELRSIVESFEQSSDIRERQVQIEMYAKLCEDKIDYRYPFLPKPCSNRRLTYHPPKSDGSLANPQSMTLVKSIKQYMAASAWGDVYTVAEAPLQFDPFLPVKIQIYAVENGEASRAFEFGGLGILLYPHMGGTMLQLTDNTTHQLPIAPQAIDDKWGTTISRFFSQCAQGLYQQPFYMRDFCGHETDLASLTNLLFELSVYDYQAANGQLQPAN